MSDRSGRRIANGHDDELGDLDLTDMQRRFVDAYIVDPNAVKAALAAGYSEKTVTTQASEVRWTPKVAQAIERRMKKAEDAADIKAAEILSEVKTLGMSNMGDYIEGDESGQPRLRDWRKLTRAQTAAVKEITIDTEVIVGKEGEPHAIKTTRVRLKTHDKEGPLNLLMRYLRLLDDGREGGNTYNNHQTVVLFQNAVSAASSIATRGLGG